MDDWSLETPSSAGDERRTPTPPVVAKAKRWKRGSQAVCVAAGVVLLAIGALAGFYIAHAQSSGERTELVDSRSALAVAKRALLESEQRNWDYYRSLDVLMVENERLKAETGDLPVSDQAPATTAPAAIPGRTYGEGVYLVGEDILPGEYAGVVTADTGYWARLKATDGAVASIVANGVVRGPFELTIIESDKAVELRHVQITER
jgi:hypothetical protein